ncbi:hypothetical protein [Mesorhizobium sp. J428]|uniref:hypothetical protein n=1 Tax=Mesorhizobium sp. J428 TaxID=2898440 RepID=UPI0021509915|nr:hypothetical protein [Mesorhizobium sp. J428]MCR5856509.1 hypothetical protein [Mesorhizobium sp. J428]
MTRRYGAKRRYVVLPGAGVTSETMPSSVAGMRAGIVKVAADNIGRYGHFSANAMVAAARSVSDELGEAVGSNDFEVVSQRFPDGPAVVAMTHAGRLALEAANPDLRVLPITKYYLPGRKPRRVRPAPCRAASALSTVLARSFPPTPSSISWLERSTGTRTARA